MATTVAPKKADAAFVVTMWPIERVIPYARNPRKNDHAVAKVAASLKEFGWRQPIVVDADGVIVVGHTRLKAAQSLGMAEVPVHIAHGLTAAQIKAYRIADNRTGEEASWDRDLLSLEIADLQMTELDLSLTGLDLPEITSLAPSTLIEGVDLDAVQEAPADPVTRVGDRILLGRHVLVCGDATKADTWDLLLAGAQADMVWTDPPYGVSYSAKNAQLNAHDGKNRNTSAIENDDLPPSELQALLRSAFTLAAAHCRDGGGWYVAAPAGPLHYEFATVLRELGIWRHTLQWVKDSLVLGRCDYQYRHEPIFYGWKPGGSHVWNGGRAQTTVLEFPRPRVNAEHPTMKPVALVQRCIENSSDPGDIVVDAFGGSGTTLMAAEASARCAAVIELSPAYCDVIVSRWESATGDRAVREGR